MKMMKMKPILYQKRPFVLAGLIVIMVAVAALQPLLRFTAQPAFQTRSGATGTIPNFSHIFQITLENTSASEIIGSSSAPYINGLVSQAGYATQFYGFTHPSLPNYFVLMSGQTPTDSYTYNDCGATTADCPVSFTTLPQEIETSGRTWKGYFQSMPSNCDLDRSWPYTPHLNPFVYSTPMINSGDCAANVVPYTQFSTDLSNHTLPNYVWISPDLCNDGHLLTSASGSCPGGGPYPDYPSAVGQANAWMAANVPQILASPEYQNNGLLIITWDEGNLGTAEDDTGCCGGAANGGHIVTLLMSPSITPSQQSVPETAYSIVRTIETAWSLPVMANEGGFNAMTEFFSADTTPPSVPTNLHSTGATSSSISLAWNASTDPDSAVSGYKIYRGGSLVTTVTGGALTYTDTGLAANTSYSYTVSAIDPTGNESAHSSTVNVSTLSGGTSVPGDCNGDGHVTIIDLSILLSHFGTNYPACDFNNDGIVNIFDLSILLSHYGT